MSGPSLAEDAGEEVEEEEEGAAQHLRPGPFFLLHREVCWSCVGLGVCVCVRCVRLR